MSEDWLVDVVRRVRTRREDLHQDGFTVINFQASDRLKLLRWLDKNTVHRFYFGLSLISFEDEKEAVIFQLSYKE